MYERAQKQQNVLCAVDYPSHIGILTFLQNPTHEAKRKTDKYCKLCTKLVLWLSLFQFIQIINY